MKLENNWQTKTLENLEKDYWGEPGYDSNLVITCHKLRKKPLDEFSIGDLRIMIGQNIGLKFLIPIAIDELRKNILAEGDFYPGDLLQAVLHSEADFWKDNRDYFIEMRKLVELNIDEIMSNNIKLTRFEKIDPVK
ncbi:contact-dependent growth inhibition system immunity protein [Pollutibacter soli]|uniref:contact-dependent growth inhibition system immunity protein n=1 Tax=Pollutibacter soli TaxID=3034157 RepID=UPI003013A445